MKAADHPRSRELGSMKPISISLVLLACFTAGCAETHSPKVTRQREKNYEYQQRVVGGSDQYLNSPTIKRR